MSGISQHIRNTHLIIVGIFFLLALTSPYIYFKIGNIFFGGTSSLYNLNLAQHFFKYASNPILGEAPPFAYYQLSRTYFIRGELDVALENAHKELEMYPENIRTYYILGLTLGYMDREEEAIDAFGKFIEHHPESWAARNDRAWLQFRIGDFDGAFATLEPVVAMTGNPWVQNTYGTLLMNKGMYAEAEEAFNFAKTSAEYMTSESWGRSYPGNDPRIYSTGLEAMRASIEKNLTLLEDVKR